MTLPMCASPRSTETSAKPRISKRCSANWRARRMGNRRLRENSSMRSKPVASAGTASLLIMLTLGSAGAAEIKAMYPPPLRTVLSELIPKFERDTGHRIVVGYQSSWLLVDRIRNGETPDVAFLSTHAADDLIREGKLARRIVFARSSI